MYLFCYCFLPSVVLSNPSFAPLTFKSACSEVLGNSLDVRTGPLCTVPFLATATTHNPIHAHESSFEILSFLAWGLGLPGAWEPGNGSSSLRNLCWGFHPSHPLNRLALGQMVRISVGMGQWHRLLLMQSAEMLKAPKGSRLHSGGTSAVLCHAVLEGKGSCTCSVWLLGALGGLLSVRVGWILFLSL